MLVFKYTTFSIFAILINLLSQYSIFQVYPAKNSLYVAMFLGTLSGLLVKYYLDKRFIFYFHAKSRKKDIKTLMMYSIMGVITTIIFWAFELVFDMLYNNERAKYVGATVGLTIGYSIKYLLDKRYVFVNKGV